MNSQLRACIMWLCGVSSYAHRHSGVVALWLIYPLECIKGHVALDENPEPGYNTLLIMMVLGMAWLRREPTYRMSGRHANH